MIEAYFFDWVDTLGRVTNERSLKQILGPNHESLLTTKSFGNLNLDSDKKRLIYNELISAQFNLFHDSEEIIIKLKEKYKLAIVSNIYCVTNELIRKKFPNFLHNFDVTTWSCEVGIKKPNPEIFTYTLKKLNLSPSQVMMIGDKEENDVIPALQLGMQARLIDRTKQNLEDVI